MIDLLKRLRLAYTLRWGQGRKFPRPASPGRVVAATDGTKWQPKQAADPALAIWPDGHDK